MSPVDPLPGASVSVTEAQQVLRLVVLTIIVNYDKTLKLWGTVLEKIPGSCLVLKYAIFDSDTQRVLRRYFRQGLNLKESNGWR